MSAGGVVGGVLLDFAAFALRHVDAAVRAELAAAVAAYWRSRRLGPVPPTLEAWARADAEHDAAVAARKAGTR